MTKLNQMLNTVYPSADALVDAPPSFFSEPQWIIFFSVSIDNTQAKVRTGKGSTFREAWNKGVEELNQAFSTQMQNKPHIMLRVDVIDSVNHMTWSQLKEKFSVTKRNYFRYGISLDPDFTHAFLEQEINANAVLYDGKSGVAFPNATNLKVFTRNRFSRTLSWPGSPDESIWTFRTRALFTDGENEYLVEAGGRHSGYRQLVQWEEELPSVIKSATDYLARQIKDSGEFHYGWFPCFDRAIPTYNTLRHASSTYALLEGWEFYPVPSQFDAIGRSLRYLSDELIKTYTLPDGTEADFLTDLRDEIKLGGNAVSILAMAKYTEITGDQQFVSQMQRLARGIRHMQDPVDGSFVHVLNSGDLSLKDAHRIIYYDGEAVFALMRLYAITEEPFLLDIVKKAVDCFIEKEHWKAHDHWLSYCINELTQYCAEERYYRFGLDNIKGYLGFIRDRITTFPTLLELIMAARKMVDRLEQSEFSYLLDDFDYVKFNEALESRARNLLDGFYWPEIAMYFKNPARISGSFFIRHHSYRVRIDDVEHYLSGYVAYYNYIRDKKKGCER